MIRNPLLPCVIPNHGCRNMPKCCCVNWRRAPPTGCQTLTAPCRSRKCCLRVCRIFCSMAPPVLPSVWRRIFRRITCVKSPMRWWRCLRSRAVRSRTCWSMCRDRTSPLKPKSLRRVMKYAKSMSRAKARCACARYGKKKTAVR